MVKKETWVIALTWLLVLASIAICANAKAGPHLQTFKRMVQPQGCHRCFVVGRAPNLCRGKVCCGDDCCFSK